MATLRMSRVDVVRLLARGDEHLGLAYVPEQSDSSCLVVGQVTAPQSHAATRR